MPVIIAAVIGAVAAGGVAAYTGAQQASAAKKAASASVAANPTPTADQTVGGSPKNNTANADNLGRAALISTSPSGVEGLDPTGRRKLLGND